MSMIDEPLRVIKIGGSLLDQFHLADALQTWRRSTRAMREVFLTGGGPLVESIRNFDKIHPIDSGHVDVLEILESDSESSDQSQMPDASEYHHVWETSEFSVMSIDEARATSVARVEPAGKGKVLTV